MLACAGCNGSSRDVPTEAIVREAATVTASVSCIGEVWYMLLRVTLSKPIDSPFEWDGGPKQTFEFSIDREYADGFSRVGSWSANRWYEVRTGRTEKETLANLKRKLRPLLNKTLKRHGAFVRSFEYVEE